MVGCEAEFIGSSILPGVTSFCTAGFGLFSFNILASTERVGVH